MRHNGWLCVAGSRPGFGAAPAVVAIGAACEVQCTPSRRLRDFSAYTHRHAQSHPRCTSVARVANACATPYGRLVSRLSEFEKENGEITTLLIDVNTLFLRLQ